ncbi:twin-arginine translocation pathway signal protein [Octadecabacter sp.]|nr:twin-arginine translocation pathway signal protein [Octadecabacter sp.]
MMNRRSFTSLLTSFAAVVATPKAALAKTISRFSLSETGHALKGYDTTAYLNSGGAQDGADDHVVSWKGAIWRFATAEDAATFEADPDAYAPQFGGYCTRAMSIKREVPGDPEVWRIFDGKLYVFFAPRGGNLFDDDQEDMIALAQVHWDTLTFVE